MLGVRRGGFCRVCLGFGPIETGFENGGDRGIGDGVDDQRPLASRFQAIRLVTAGKRQNAEGSAISIRSSLAQSRSCLVMPNQSRRPGAGTVRHDRCPSLGCYGARNSTGMRQSCAVSKS
jgi:hypothetical protein